MAKSRNCLVKIKNGSDCETTYVANWFRNGRLAEGFSWTETIRPGERRDVLSYELDWSWAGCSGYVTYKMFDTCITIAFSNPIVGVNKLGVGTGGRRVWQAMSNHEYKEFTVEVDASGDKEVKIKFDCICTGGRTNICNVDITSFRN